MQFAVAGLLYQLGFRIDVLANPFGEPIALGWASLPFTMLWIVGVINAMNLIDGLDGLAGGVALVAVITTFLVSLQRGHPLMMLFSSALAGAIVGFLFYNFNPASIFMGDTGSMFLGFVLATTAIQTNQKASTAVAVLIPGDRARAAHHGHAARHRPARAARAGRCSRPTRSTSTTG